MRKINTRSLVRATRSTPREVSRRILLNLVREHEPISRADLAGRMEIDRGMVTSLADELISERGMRNTAGEFGHVPLTADGPDHRRRAAAWSPRG